MTSQSTDISIRPPAMADLDAVVALITACDLALTGEADEAGERRVLERDWGDPALDLARDAWVATLPDGRIIGYEIVSDLTSTEAAGCDGYVHPEWCNLGVGTQLLRRAVQRMRQVAPSLPPHLPVRLRANIYSTEAQAHALFQAEGFKIARHYWQMRISFTEPPIVAPLPAGIRIQPFRPGEDESRVHAMIEEAFVDHWGHTFVPFDEWRRQMMERDDYDPALWLLAWDGDELAGAAVCFPRAEMGWVRALGVRRPWRQRGIAMALLQHAFALFHQRGFSMVGLGVDAANPTGAVRLYERAGMQQVYRYDMYEREIRPALLKTLAVRAAGGK